jgi:hypothetical protein
MIDVVGLDFYNSRRILRESSIPMAGGGVDLADSAAHATSRLDTRHCKLSPLLSKDTSDSVTSSSDKLMVLREVKHPIARRGRDQNGEYRQQRN